MLTLAGCQERRKRLWDSLPEPLDWILLSEPQHLMYFANFWASPFVFRYQNAPGLLLLGADGSSLLIVDNLQHAAGEKAYVDALQTPLWYRSRESAPIRQELLVKTALEAMASRQGDQIGIEPATNAGVLEGLRAVRPALQTWNLAPTIHALKRAKAPDELALIQRSLRAMEAGFQVAREQIQPGMTELQAFELVQQAAIESAGEPVQIYGDFAAGPHAENGGGGPTSRVIEAGELFLLDFSVVVSGYRGDLASTFVVAGGKATERQREMADGCLAAMAAGEAALKPGTPCQEVDSQVRAAFAKRGLDTYFRHHSGHGVGLGHPDPPYIVPESEDTLQVGDVVTLEPGVYIKEVGGMRFEHNYLVTETGYERLSRHHLGLESPL